MNKNYLLLVAGVLLIGVGLYFNAQATPQRGIEYVGLQWYSAPSSESNEVVETELTVYTSGRGGLALVKEKRTAQLVSGVNALSVQGVTKGIDATSIYFRDLTDEEAIILEQNYDYDLVSEYKLLEKFVDEVITVETDSASFTGTLLSAGKPLLLQTESGVHSISEYNNVVFPDTKELITKPTINWLLNANNNGEHEFEIGYLSSGLDWHAEYVAVTNEAENALDLRAWVSIENTAGKTFEDAKLKLVAGDVHTVSEPVAYPMYEMDMGRGASNAKQFSEESFSEYHLYSLERPTTIKDNEVKQISFFEADGVSVNKELVFEPSHSNKVQVKLEFNNDIAPMPAGKVRVYKPDSDGQLQFVGEDLVDHTPTNENVRLYVGDAFDIVAEQTQTNFNQKGECASTKDFEVSLRNHKDKAIVVKVVESSLWGEWTIDSGTPFEKEDAFTAVWSIPVAANGEATLNYAVNSRWC